MLRDNWGTQDPDYPGDPDKIILDTPMDKLRREDFTGTKRTWLQCRVGMIDAYAKTLGLDLGPCYVSLADFENIGKRSLLRYRLSNYRKLCIREFLGISFEEYIANPRWVINDYDSMCSEWTNDPQEAAKLAAAALGTKI